MRQHIIQRRKLCEGASGTEGTQNQLNASLIDYTMFRGKWKIKLWCLKTSTKRNSSNAKFARDTFEGGKSMENKSNEIINYEALKMANTRAGWG